MKLWAGTNSGGSGCVVGIVAVEVAALCWQKITRTGFGGCVAW